MVARTSPQPSRRPIGLPAALVLTALAATGATVAAPLLVYSVTLAIFGAAHVLSEFRYVDRRFGRSLGIARAGVMGLLLIGAAGARALGVFHVLAPAVALPLELSCVVLLALAAVSRWSLQSLIAVAVAFMIGIATSLAPFDTAVTLAVLHNLTPLAFLWEIVPPRDRPAAMPLAATLFVGLPLLVATGWPRELIAAAGVDTPLADPFRAGPLADHLRVYVPSSLLGSAAAIDLFSGAVVAQCAHYAATIVVLPALLGHSAPSAQGLLPWPRERIFLALVVLASVAMALLFADAFAATRSLYGIIASIHAWIEIPLIVIALTRRPEASIASPAATEAALHDSERANA